MCWNPEVSISTFGISSICILFAYYNNILQFPAYVVFQLFVSMQLVEYFLWTYLHNSNLNYLFSIIGFTIVIMLPFFNILSIEFFKYKYKIIFCYLLFVFYVLVTEKIEYKTTVAENKHLRWEWLDLPFSLAIIWLFFFTFKNIYYFYKGAFNEIYKILFCISTFLLSYYSFYKYKTWGSMWCYFANIIAFKYLYKTFIKIYN